MKRIILGMSEDMRTIKNELKNSAKQVNLHLIKLAYYPESDSVNHWRGEVYGFINSVSKLKGKNRYPKFEFIYNNTWKLNSDTIESYEWLAIREEGISPNKVLIDTASLIDNMSKYYRWLASELSSRGVIAKQDCYAKLKQLGF